MGIFSALFGSKAKKSRKINRVYITRIAANRAIVKYLLQEQNRRIILIYYFRETYNELLPFTEALNNVCWVNGLVPSNVSQVEWNDKAASAIVFCETYPDPLADDFLAQTLEKAGYVEENMLMYHGLDDAVFVPFGAERIQNLMLRLGMKEDEPVEHTMVTNSIERAREKIAKKGGLMSRHNSRADMCAYLQKN